MRIAFITTGHIEGHASMKRALGMGPELAWLGHEVAILMLEHPANRAREEKVAGLHYVGLPAGLTVSAERAWKEGWLRAHPQEVVFINALGWRNAVKPRRCGGKAIFMVEHCELESANLSTPRLRRWAQAWLEWTSVWRYQVAVPASHFLQSLFRHRSFLLGERQKVLRLPYACGTPGQRTRVEGGGEPKRIFHVGTVNKAYGIENLLHGLAELKARRTDWEAVFAGQGRHFDEMVALSQDMGLRDSVRFTGFIDQPGLDASMERADVFLSHLGDSIQDWARCPSKLYLYLPYDRPIVTSRVGDNAHLLGRSGFYYTHDCAASIADALEQALDVPGNWTSGIDPEEHTWKARSNALLEWVGQHFPHTSSGRPVKD